MRSTIFALVLREIRGKFGANRLGGFWFIFEPLAHILGLLAIFVFLKGHASNVPAQLKFLINGVVPFILFKNIALTGMESVRANKGLFAYRQIKPFDIILARALVELLLMLFIYTALIFFVSFVFEFNAFPIDPISWAFTFFIGILFSVASAIIFCIATRNYPESAALIRLMYFPLYFISGVIFPIALMPRKLMEFLLWNPYLHLIELLRADSIDRYVPHSGVNIMYPLYCTLIITAFALILYRNNRYRLIAG